MNKHSLQGKQGLSLLLRLIFLMMGTSCRGSISLGRDLMTNAGVLFLAEQVRVFQHLALSSSFTLIISLTCLHMLNLASVSSIGDFVLSNAAVPEGRIAITLQVLQALQKPAIFHFSPFPSTLFCRDLRRFDPIIIFMKQNQKPGLLVPRFTSPCWFALETVTGFMVLASLFPCECGRTDTAVISRSTLKSFEGRSSSPSQGGIADGARLFSFPDVLKSALDYVPLRQCAINTQTAGFETGPRQGSFCHAEGHCLSLG